MQVTRYTGVDYIDAKVDNCYRYYYCYTDIIIILCESINLTFYTCEFL